MLHETEDGHPPYLTTKEVADLLRVKERKVYDLAAADEIPHRRITGKLLFPRAEIMAWIEGPGAGPAADRPPVIAGSHDPLLDWAIRESQSGLATLFDGSLTGLDGFAAGQAVMSGLHVPEADGWNVGTVASRGLTGCVLVRWAKRDRGLLIAPEMADRVSSVTDLRRKRVVMRQPGAGAASLLDQLLAAEGVSSDDFVPAASLARTELDAAAAIAAGEADVALGLRTMAQQFHLPFVHLLNESYDLLIDRKAFFSAPVQALMAFVRRDAFQAKAAALGGYDIDGIGDVRWVSP